MSGEGRRRRHLSEDETMNTSNIDLSIEDIVARCTASLDELDDMLLGVEPMDPDEARRSAKLPRENGDEIVEEIARQCRLIDLERAGRDTTVEAMLEDMERARALREVLYRQHLAHARLRALRMRLESVVWRSAMTFYAVLRRTAAREPNLKEGLDPVVRFFRRRRARRGLDRSAEVTPGAPPDDSAARGNVRYLRREPP
jgi:hypothetical protein